MRRESISKLFADDNSKYMDRTTKFILNLLYRTRDFIFMFLTVELDCPGFFKNCLTLGPFDFFHNFLGHWNPTSFTFFRYNFVYNFKCLFFLYRKCGDTISETAKCKAKKLIPFAVGDATSRLISPFDSKN